MEKPLQSTTVGNGGNSVFLVIKMDYDMCFVSGPRLVDGLQENQMERGDSNSA